MLEISAEDWNDGLAPVKTVENRQDVRRRAALRAPGPFLKWAGGKTQLLPALDAVLPESIENYFEPFVGGGALFFFLRGQGRIGGQVTLADVNPELINAYWAVQNHPDQLLEMLAEYRRGHSKERYYAVRTERFEPGAAGAARTIYLNKTGFNGLYRVNRAGGFNVPMGRYKNPSIFDEAAIRAASAALQGVCLVVRPYRQTIEEAGRGDFLYLDPPYVPVSTTAMFTAYSADGFGSEDQARLSHAVRAAHERGAHFMLSNSFVPVVLELYEGFRIMEVPAARRINCQSAKRGIVSEALVMNYGRSGGRIEREGMDRLNSRVTAE